MNMTRQDAWTKEEDARLAATVLRYIKQGKTQLEAFKEVAELLSRTSAACGFRWNASVRKEYTDAIQQAKQARNQKRLSHDFEASGAGDHPINADPLNAAISLLEKLQSHSPLSNNLQLKETETTLNELKQENKYLKGQLLRYEEAWQEMVKLWQWVQNNDGNEA